MKNYMIIPLLASAMALSSCTGIGVAMGVGVAAGTAAVQEGGISRAMSDVRIQTSINDLWFRHDVNMFLKLDLTVNQGRVLITGIVQEPDHRVEAVRLAWQPEGVLQVINEIKVAESTGIVGYAKDSWISARLRTKLIMDRDVESINYSIDTVQGSVYLMGFAQNQMELDHVIDVARRIENVKQVVSYVKIAGTPELKAADGAQGSSGQNPNVNNNASSATGEPVDWNQESVYD